MTNPNVFISPEARYILPTFEERTSYGFKRQDPYNKLFEDRIVFLGVQVDDASADDIMAQLLVLESQDPDRDITMYINSPGGSFTAMTAIYDTMQYIRPQIQTVVLGQAASAAAVLLAAGAPGKRLALPNSRASYIWANASLALRTSASQPVSVAGSALQAHEAGNAVNSATSSFTLPSPRNRWSLQSGCGSHTLPASQ